MGRTIGAITRTCVEVIRCSCLLLLCLSWQKKYALYCCYFSQPHTITKELLALDLHCCFWRRMDQYTGRHYQYEQLDTRKRINVFVCALSGAEL